jgi:hypothetical protein
MNILKAVTIGVLTISAATNETHAQAPQVAGGSYPDKAVRWVVTSSPV